jgi:hypothetical protein
MKSIEELRKISTAIVNLVLRNKLTVEESIYVIENAKTFLLTAKIVDDFDRLKKTIDSWKSKTAQRQQ